MYVGCGYRICDAVRQSSKFVKFQLICRVLSGICDVRTYLQHGLKVAVGTDVAGGYSPSMLDALRMTVIASRVHALAQRKHFGVGLGADAGQMKGGNVSVSDGGSELGEAGVGVVGEDIIEGEMEHIELIGGLGPNGGVSACSVVEVHHHTKHHDHTEDYVTTFVTGSTHPHPAPSTPVITATAASSTSNDATTITPSMHTAKPAAAAAVIPAPEPYHPLTYLEAYHLATQGGAEVLGMGNVVGNFLVGKMCDALVIDVAVQDSPIDIWEGEGVLEKFQKFLFLGDDRNIVGVFVGGRKVM